MKRKRVFSHTHRREKVGQKVKFVRRPFLWAFCEWILWNRPKNNSLKTTWKEKDWTAGKMAGHQTMVKSCVALFRDKLVTLLSWQWGIARKKLLSLHLTDCLSLETLPCLVVGAESDTSARTEGTRVEKYLETILARGILLKEYLSLVFFASDWPSTDRRPLCTRTGALSLLLIDPPQVLCQVAVVVAVLT